MRKKIVAVLLALVSVTVMGVANAPVASAQQYDLHDWGWVQGYYGGVHMFMHDTCPYTQFKQGCRVWVTDHHIWATGQIIRDIQYLPEGIWIYTIVPGQAGVSPALTQWGPNPTGQYMHATWETLSGHATAGVRYGNYNTPSNGVLGGNTLHNSNVTTLYNAWDPDGLPGWGGGTSTAWMRHY